MSERTLHELLPDLFSQPLRAIQSWASRQQLTRHEALLLYHNLAKRNQLEEWAIKVQLAYYLFDLPGWTEEELKSENTQVFGAFGGGISSGREPDDTAYEIPYKLLRPKIKELELARWQQTYDRLPLQELFSAYRRELPDNERRYVQNILTSKLATLDANSILTLESFESHQDLCYRLRKALDSRFNELPVDDLSVLAREKRYEHHRKAIFSALASQGWPIDQFRALLAERSQDQEKILEAISTRADLPFELILELLRLRLRSYERSKFCRTLKSVAPRLTCDQLQTLWLAVTDRQGADWWFFSPILEHWPIETQIELFRRIHHFPSSFFETETATPELLERLFRETEPDAEEFVDLARGIAEQSKKRHARAVA